MNTIRTSHAIHVMLMLFLLVSGIACTASASGESVVGDEIMQAHAVFTVAESKRLIAKAVVRMPLVEEALKDGIVIVCKGTTNTYVAEELLKRDIAPGALVYGHVLPAEIEATTQRPRPRVP